MKKTLIGTAIALAMSGSAFAETDVGGQIRFGLQNTDELEAVSGKLVINFKGMEDLGNGLEFSYGIEFENDSADKETNQFHNDKSWIAIGGDFGKIIGGEYGDFAGFACGGTDLYNYAGSIACDTVHNTSPADAVQYRGSFGMVNVGAAITFDATGPTAPSTTRDDVSHTLFGLQVNIGDDISIGAQMVNASENGGIGGVPADETGTQIGGTWNIMGSGFVLGATLADDSDDDATGIAIQMPLGGMSVAVSAESGDALKKTAGGESVHASIGSRLGSSEDAYWGAEFHDYDELDDESITVYMGTNF